MKFILSVAIFVFIGAASIAQDIIMPINKWVEKLSDKKDIKNETTMLLWDSIANNTDSFRMNKLIAQLQAHGKHENLYFNTRFNLFKVMVLNHKDFLRSDRASKAVAMQLLKVTMQKANETNDEYLIAKASEIYFLSSQFYKEMDLAVIYGMYCVELYEKLFGNSYFLYYQFLAEQMFRVREYEKCKSFCLKKLNINNEEQIDAQAYKMQTLNTLALAYHRTGSYDTAMFFYNKALGMAYKVNRPDWVGIISGNMGQVFFLEKQYDTARILLERDYHSSAEHKYFDNAANSLQWAARCNAALGNRQTALEQVREAMKLIRKIPDDNYQQNIYKAASEIYHINGLSDSSFFYAAKYNDLHDAIEKKINLSSIAMSQVRLNEEKSWYNIRRLQQEKESQRLQRNFIILGIVLLALISILLINRQRLRLKHRKESLEQEKKIIETEVTAAKLQMEMFTRNIIEKTNLVEKLEQQMKESNASAGQQEIITELSHLTILTEDDWDKFKELFEKIYPMFFQRLKITAPDITVAEQRMAALIRLQLTTRQMASMQGISPDSVHKTRQRLRQRIGVTNETNLEEFFVSL